MTDAAARWSDDIRAVLKGGEHWKVHINSQTGGVPDLPAKGSVEVPGAVADRPWGTSVSPSEAIDSGGALGILQEFIDAAGPPDSRDPRDFA